MRPTPSSRPITRPAVAHPRGGDLQADGAPQLLLGPEPSPLRDWTHPSLTAAAVGGGCYHLRGRGNSQGTDALTSKREEGWVPPAARPPRR